MDVKHSIKNPAGIKVMLGMTIICFIQLPGLMEVLNGKSRIAEHILQVLIFLAGMSILFLMLYRALKNQTEMHLYANKIFINRHTVEATEIQFIMIMGYFKPIIGLKPYGKKIVPIPLCFRFSKDTEKGIDDMMKWAEDNHVRVVNKSFIRWI